MNEQEISGLVKAVLESMKDTGSEHASGHVCKCKQHKMTLDKANALIEKVKAKASEMGVLTIQDNAEHCKNEREKMGLQSTLACK